MPPDLIEVVDELDEQLVSNENTREVHKELNSSLSKYTYFLLTAAGAGIGFVTNQTRDADVNYSQLPLAICVLCWVLSFFFGCRHIDYKHAALHANIDLHRVQSGNHPMAGDNPQLMQIGNEALRKIFQEKVSLSSDFAVRQYWFLISGAVFYVIWHVLEMYLRTNF
ncbi:MAG: hypothetical protein ACTSV1_05420 [Alphaproteobacteria bacterium]